MPQIAMGTQLLKMRFASLEYSDCKAPNPMCETI